MNPSRRKFTRMLALTVAAPLVPPQANPQEKTVLPEAVEVSMKTLDIPMGEERAKQVRESVEQTLERVKKLRAYPLRREVEPALNLGVFDVNN